MEDLAYILLAVMVTLTCVAVREASKLHKQNKERQMAKSHASS